MLAREIRYHIHDLCSPIFLYEMRLKLRCMILLGHSFHALIETNGFLFKNRRDFRSWVCTYKRDDFKVLYRSKRGKEVEIT